MKAVLDLTKAITDRQYYDEQFHGGGSEKNILFVAPQLTSKHLYKFILPFFSFYNERVYTAITSLEKYNPFEQIVQLKVNLTQTEILWANFIVFPFTTMDLSKDYGLYQAIREVNPHCKIVFFVDFNFYNLPDEHPHKELFGMQDIIDTTERNILYSDLCLTTNLFLRSYLLKMFEKLAETKYKDIETIPVNFGAIPYLIDEEIVLQNVDFELNKPAPVINKDIFKKVADVAEEIKKEDLEVHKDKAVRLANKKSAPKKVTVKTTKVIADKNKKGKGKVVEKPNAKANGKNGKSNVKGNSNGKIEEPIVETKNEMIKEVVSQEPIPQVIPLPKKYRIGIICSMNNYHDIKFYNDVFQKINDRYGDNVSLIFVGYDYEEDKLKILDGVNFEYVKQVSIIHYFKQFQSLNLDLVFIPLEKNVHNVSSENLNKYLECGLFKIPVIVEDMFPYSQVILHQRNGFLYKGKESFFQELDAILTNTDLIKSVSEQAKKDVLGSYIYDQKNIEIISAIYG